MVTFLSLILEVFLVHWTHSFCVFIILHGQRKYKME